MPWYRRHRGVEVDERRPTTQEILDSLRDPLPPGPLEWGIPTRCPRCEDWGYIDRLDLVRRVMLLHCPTCQDHWSIGEDQIEALRRHDEQPADADSS
jgi:hypothetical protein